MKPEDRVFTLLIESNPVPRVEALDLVDQDGARYLATLELRSSEVTKLDTRPDTDEKEKRPTGVWLVAAAAVLILGVSIVLTTRSQPEPAANDEPTTTVDAESDAGESAAIAVVLATFDVYNSGDHATWVELRRRGPASIGNSDQEMHQAMMAASGHYEVAECITDQRSDWPELAEPGAEDLVGYYVRCDTVLTNAFHGAAGLEIREQYKFVVDGGEVIASGSQDVSPPGAAAGEEAEWYYFTRDFRVWLTENKPEVEAEMSYVLVDGFPIYPRLESIQLALAHVGEYVDTLP